jgi:hypothetical protein
MADIEETKRQQQELELSKTFSVNFTKRELLIVNNILLQKEFRVGDVLAILPILDKIRPFIQPRELNTKGKEVITNHKN